MLPRQWKRDQALLEMQTVQTASQTLLSDWPRPSLVEELVTFPVGERGISCSFSVVPSFLPIAPLPGREKGRYPQVTQHLVHGMACPHLEAWEVEKPSGQRHHLEAWEAKPSEQKHHLEAWEVVDSASFLPVACPHLEA